MSGTRKDAGTERMSLTRRALLKTTAYALVGWIALALAFSARNVAAGPIGGTPETYLAAAVLGQSNSADDSAADPHQRSANLLRRARQAMAERDFVAAESLISQADTLGVKYSIFYQGDTPKKVRRELERQRNSAAPAKSNGLFSMISANRDQAPASDPFAAHRIAPPTTAGQSVTPLPRIGYASPTGAAAQTNSGQFNPTAQPNVTARTPRMMSQAAGKPSNDPLRTARLALAVGDVRRAMEFVERARASRTNYQSLGDTPEKVEASIRRQQELQGLDKGTEAYARASARSLMEQAGGLLHWNEYDEAERLARRAAALPIIYGAFEQKPQELLQRIASARRQDRSAAVEAAGYAMASGDGANLASRQKAVQLVGQARDAIGAGRLDQAEMLAGQARQFGAQQRLRPRRGLSGVGVAGFAAHQAGRGVGGRAGRWPVRRPERSEPRHARRVQSGRRSNAEHTGVGHGAGPSAQSGRDAG